MSNLDGLINAVSTLAPSVARMLGGPLAGAVVDILAQGFGTSSDPTAISQAIAADPELAKQQLAYLEKWAESETARFTGQAANVDATKEIYLAELNRGGFYSWLRPCAGWVTLIQSAIFTVIMAKQLWEANYQLLAQSPMLLVFMAPPAALAGVYFWNKSQERQALATGGSANVVESFTNIIKQITGKEKSRA